MSIRGLLLESPDTPPRLRADLAKVADRLIVARLAPGLGGVWTELEDGVEVISIGYPDRSKHDFFRPQAPTPGKPTCVSVHLERLAFGRKITDVVVQSRALVPIVVHALGKQDLRCWTHSEPSAPSRLADSPAPTPDGLSAAVAAIAALPRSES